MDAHSVLTNMTNLSNAKNFLSLLEIKFLSDKKKLSQLKIAKKSLDRALVQLIFDVPDRLENIEQNHKAEISSEIMNALSQLENCGDETLNRTLLDLVTFFQIYENCSDRIFSSRDEEDLKNLRAKTLLITAERFG